MRTKALLTLLCILIILNTGSALNKLSNFNCFSYLEGSKRIPNVACCILQGATAIFHKDTQCIASTVHGRTLSFLRPRRAQHTLDSNVQRHSGTHTCWNVNTWRNMNKYIGGANLTFRKRKTMSTLNLLATESGSGNCMFPSSGALEGARVWNKSPVG